MSNTSSESAAGQEDPDRTGLPGQGSHSAEDGENGRVAHGGQLGRSLSLIDEIGHGGFSTVYRAELTNPLSLKAAAPAFVKGVLGGNAEVEVVERHTRVLEANIDAIAPETNHAIDHEATAPCRVVAVKVVRLPQNGSGGNGSGNGYDRFVGRELRSMLLQQESLPGTPRILGGHFDRASGELHLYMEFLDGYNMGQLLAALGEPMPVRAGLDIAALIAREGEMVDRAGLIHRDWKPGNQQVTNRGQTKTLDLGLVRPQNANATKVTNEGAGGMGTPSYVAPEQARGEAVSDTKVDVYSLGIEFIEMFTGRVPVSGANAQATLTMRLTLDAKSEPPEIHWPGLPALRQRDARMAQFIELVLIPFLRRMIHPDPKRRPTMEQVAQFFHRFSSFGNVDFTSSFTDLESYDHHRLGLVPPPGPEGYGSAAEMVRAIIAGSEEAARLHDFLPGVDLDTVTQEFPLPKEAEDQQRWYQNRKVQVVIVGVLICLVVGGVIIAKWPKGNAGDNGDDDGQKIKKKVPDVDSPKKELVPVDSTVQTCTVDKFTVKLKINTYKDGDRMWKAPVEVQSVTVAGQEIPIDGVVTGENGRILSINFRLMPDQISQWMDDWKLEGRRPHGHMPEMGGLYFSDQGEGLHGVLYAPFAAAHGVNLGTGEVLWSSHPSGEKASPDKVNAFFDSNFSGGYDRAVATGAVRMGDNTDEEIQNKVLFNSKTKFPWAREQSGYVSPSQKKSAEKAPVDGAPAVKSPVDRVSFFDLPEDHLDPDSEASLVQAFADEQYLQSGGNPELVSLMNDLARTSDARALNGADSPQGTAGSGDTVANVGGRLVLSLREIWGPLPSESDGLLSAPLPTQAEDGFRPLLLSEYLLDVEDQLNGQVGAEVVATLEQQEGISFSEVAQTLVAQQAMEGILSADHQQQIEHERTRLVEVHERFVELVKSGASRSDILVVGGALLRLGWNLAKLYMSIPY